MKQRVKAIRIEEINDSLANIPEDSKIYIGKSMAISDKILAFMEDKKWMQKELALRMEKSEAEVSKLLSGTHNYTLRMISKIEAVLGRDIIIVPEFLSNNFLPTNINGNYSFNKEIKKEKNTEWKNAQVAAKVVAINCIERTEQVAI